MFTLSPHGTIASKHTQYQGAKVSRLSFVSLKNMGEVRVTYPSSYPKQLEPLHLIDYVAEILNDTDLSIRCLEKINKFINPYSLHDRGTPPLSSEGTLPLPPYAYIEGGPTKIFSKNSWRKMKEKYKTLFKIPETQVLTKGVSIYQGSVEFDSYGDEKAFNKGLKTLEEIREGMPGIILDLEDSYSKGKIERLTENINERE